MSDRRLARTLSSLGLLAILLVAALPRGDGARTPIPGVVLASGTAVASPSDGEVSLPIPSSTFPPPMPSLDTPNPDPEGEHGIFLLVNEDRRLSGLAPLHRSAALDVLAHARSADLVRTGFWSHCAGDPEPDVSQCPRTGLALLAYGAPRGGWSENLAWIPTTETVDWPLAFNSMWIDSPPHHVAIVNPDYHAVGIAMTCCTDGGAYLVAVQELSDTESWAERLVAPHATTVP